MRSPRPLDLTFPRRRRWPRWAIAASVATHVVVLWIIAQNRWIPLLHPPAEQPVVLVPLPPVGAMAPVSRPGRARPARPVTPAAGRITPPAPQAEERHAEVTPPAAPAAAPPAAADTGTGFAATRIGPARARGRLWVEPPALPTPELAAQVARGHVALVDSATRAIIQAFLDSIAADPASKTAMLPSWTTTIAGQKFGLDSRYIYIAGLKIPAAVLALLPLPHGNESHAFDRSSWLYDDLRYAAQRSANLADFKAEIRKLRERKEQEREFQKNQRTPPKEQPQ